MWTRCERGRPALGCGIALWLLSSMAGMLVGCAGGEEDGPEPCFPSCGQCGSDGCGGTCPDRCDQGGMVCDAASGGCLRAPSRCVAGDPTVEERELSAGWVTYPCVNLDVCTDGRCRWAYYGLAQLGSAVCFFPSGDGVNNGALRLEVGSSFPALIDFDGVPIVPVVPEGMNIWPYAWEIPVGEHVEVRYSFEQFAEPTEMQLSLVEWADYGRTCLVTGANPYRMQVASYNGAWASATYLIGCLWDNAPDNWVSVGECGGVVRIAAMCLVAD
jgi:hypothetical protein